MGKSTSMKTTCYAKGGPVMGKVSEFMKTENEFTSQSEARKGTDEVFGKGGDGQAKGPSNPQASNKMTGHGPNCNCAKCR